MKVKVLNLDGSDASSEVELNDAVFGIEPRADILHRVVTWQLENRRGIARATRERSDVARTGKKFGNQKGGGTARQFDVSLNKKIRTLGLKMALSAKARSGLVIIDNLDVEGGKTKALGLQLAQAGFGKKVLVIDGEAVNAGFARASANLVGINVLPAMGANVYDILKHDTLVLTRAAVEKLEARFNG